MGKGSRGETNWDFCHGSFSNVVYSNGDFLYLLPSCRPAARLGKDVLVAEKFQLSFLSKDVWSFHGEIIRYPFVPRATENSNKVSGKLWWRRRRYTGCGKNPISWFPSGVAQGCLLWPGSPSSLLLNIISQAYSRPRRFFLLFRNKNLKSLHSIAWCYIPFFPN